MTNEPIDQLLFRLPERSEMLRRLLSVDSSSHTEQGLYPRLLASAGREQTPTAVVMILVLATADYAQGLPPQMRGVLTLRMPEFIRVLIDDETAREQALRELRQVTGVSE